MPIETLTQTPLGQYVLIDEGTWAADGMRFAWVETLGRDSRVMCRFRLMTDAIEMRSKFAAREDWEIKRVAQNGESHP